MSRITDSLNNAPVDDTAQASMAILDRLQNFNRPGTQVAAAAAVFLTLCRRFQVDAKDAFTATTNLMNDANDKLRPEFKAVLQYAENEL